MNDAGEAAVFRETLELFCRYSRGLEVVHDEGKGCYETVLYEHCVPGKLEKLLLDVPVPLTRVLACTLEEYPGEGYLFSEEVGLDCDWKRLAGGNIIAHITRPLKLVQRKGFTLAWRVDAGDAEAMCNKLPN